jgi:hypothetical protein
MAADTENFISSGVPVDYIFSEIAGGGKLVSLGFFMRHILA